MRDIAGQRRCVSPKNGCVGNLRPAYGEKPGVLITRATASSSSVPESVAALSAA